MDIEEKKAKLEFLQKFFAKSFWISFILLIVASILCVVLHKFQMDVVGKYFPVSEENFNLMILMILGIWKVLVVQFTLIPALVIFCIRKCCKCNCCEKE